MNISLRSNIDQVLGYTARIHPQFRFAAALALTRTVQAARDAVRQESASILDRPTPFTQAGYFAIPARKDNLQAAVDVKDKQAEYLLYQVKGGSRAPKKLALRLPSNVELNAYGNLPTGIIKQLIARAQAGKRATKRQGQRFGVSTELDLFYGDPGDGRPPGIYKRVVISATRHQLIPIIVFPHRSASYQRKLDYFGVIERTVQREIEPQLRAAWAKALASAR